jgi:hypothetical protein
MKFFFPDSQDQIDPTFDFITEERSPYRIRQRDDCYAHETVSAPPFDGILVSKTIVDGTRHGAGKYTQAQRYRLYRVGVRQFFRLDETNGPPLESMGDCGAFSYVKEDEPPYTPEEVIDFYAECSFDLGLSVDHVILGYNPMASTDSDDEMIANWRYRQLITLQLAKEFLSRCRARKVTFEPVGVAQGWSPTSYAAAVRVLQHVGYQRIALGGMVPLKTYEILSCLKAIDGIREPRTQLHLLGITRCDSIDRFRAFGVTSFDSTSPFRQAFKDDRDNYYTLNRTYTALRVPQVDANPKLKARIRAGQISQPAAVELEQRCLGLVRVYDTDTSTMQAALDALRAYEELYDGRQDRTDAYRELLEDRPWRACPCGICEHAGIEVAIFRGSERNKRRGFHNLFVFHQRLQRELLTAVGSTRTPQARGKGSDPHVQQR